MKTLVRFSVIALVLAGAAASTQTSASASTKIAGKVSSMPVPPCPPDGSTTCGF